MIEADNENQRVLPGEDVEHVDSVRASDHIELDELTRRLQKVREARLLLLSKVVFNDAELYDAFADLSAQKRAIQAELDQCEKEIATLEPRIMESFQANGISRIRSKRYGLTLFIERTLWAGTVESEEATETKYEKACRALKSVGLGHFVHERFNVQTLSSYFRELEREIESDPDRYINEVNEIIPEPLRGSIKLTEKFKIKTRK